MAVKSRSHANRGMKLEKLIDDTNAYYLKEGIADVQKIPTPFRSLGSIGNGLVKGFNEKGYLPDYVGIYRGRAILFDAKETSIKNLSLDNIHQHQYDRLESWHKMGAQSFLIVHFKEYDKYYHLPFGALGWAWNRALNGGRKSIALSEFEERGFELVRENSKMLNYLEGY